MTAVLLGRTGWSSSRNREGHREYRLKTRVKASIYDGPAIIMNTPGLPMIGTYWSYGNDFDPWAFCMPDMTVTPFLENEANRYWDIEQTFSTLPMTRCFDLSIEDPLLEPPKISGNFNSVQRETKVDRHGEMIESSSHEQITGVMKDDARPTVIFEWNTPILDLEWMAMSINTLNDAPMWGLPARHIKLSQISWVRHVYQLCTFYFSKRIEFEVRYEGFDCEGIGDRVLDSGFKCLRGKWIAPADTETGSWTWEQDTGADEDNLNDFIRVKDPFDDPSPMRVPLDGHGGRLTDPANPVFLEKIELYDETNFLAYGIPAVLS